MAKKADSIYVYSALTNIGEFKLASDKERRDIKYKSKWLCEFHKYGTKNIYI